MAADVVIYRALRHWCDAKGVKLVAVSKLKPVEDIMALYEAGCRDFGENYAQELAAKAGALPPDIRWHFIGHLQTNKVKIIAPHVHCIQSVDSEKLLAEIAKQCGKVNKRIAVLLQVHIAVEDTKTGFDYAEAEALIPSVRSRFPQIDLRGLMGMASNIADTTAVEKEFDRLHQSYQKHQLHFVGTPLLSMGMSADYELAVANGSNAIRVGSALFGARS